jgi:glycosyltransferase involved in cell wall biosynthesis
MYDLFVRPETRLAMGQAARRRMEREFSWDTVARRTEALYQQFVHDTRLVSGSISY